MTYLIFPIPVRRYFWFHQTDYAVNRMDFAYHKSQKSNSMKKTGSIFSFGIMLALSIVIYSCSSGSDGAKSTETPKAVAEAPKEKKVEAADPAKGVGEITHVELTSPLNEDMIPRGRGMFEMKCSACHKLTEEKLVGPGWKGITTRRTPEWIMNMITNTDAMLDKDPEAQKMLETCIVRMPNQGLSMGDCRDILEFMRKNDGQK
jgi:cytochrome c2